MEKTTFIFDFDNTLVDSLDFWYEVMEEKTFLHFGLVPDKRIKSLRKGKSNEEIANIFLELTGLDVPVSDVVAFWNKAMEDAYVSKVKLINGAKEFLYNLKRRGAKLVLASATEEELLKIALKHFDIEVFDAIYTESNLGFAKHDKMFFQTCLKKIGANAEEVVLFEDSFVSLKSATSNGIERVALLHKYNKRHKKELKQMCKLVIKDFKDIKMLEDLI